MARLSTDLSVNTKTEAPLKFRQLSLYSKKDKYDISIARRYLDYIHNDSRKIKYKNGRFPKPTSYIN